MRTCLALSALLALLAFIQKRDCIFSMTLLCLVFSRGRIVCNPVLCPNPKCDNPIIPEGECCASCLSSEVVQSEAGCYFEGDKKFHLAGTRWHPYIPPWGFSRCAVCTCGADTLKVECHSKQCPNLNCPSELQVRPDQLACCKVNLK